MNWIGNAIVGMWFIPVTLFIIIPLIVFAGNLLAHSVYRLTKSFSRQSKQQLAGAEKMCA